MLKLARIINYLECHWLEDWLLQRLYHFPLYRFIWQVQKHQAAMTHSPQTTVLHRDTEVCHKKQWLLKPVISFARLQSVKWAYKATASKLKWCRGKIQGLKIASYTLLVQKHITGCKRNLTFQDPTADSHRRTWWVWWVAKFRSV